MPSMNQLAALASFALWSTVAWTAETTSFQCRTTDGVYRPPGSAKLAPAADRDPSIIGTVFTVDRRAGSVHGSALYATAGRRVEVVRDMQDAYELLVHNEHRDISTFHLAKFGSAWTFSYYSGWFGLLLTGACRES